MKIRSALLLLVVFTSMGEPARGQVSPGQVKSEHKVSAVAGGLTGPLDDDDEFGTAVSWIDDLDGNGVRELAVGAQRDDDGGTDRGAVWLLFMNADGTVASEVKISSTAGGFGGALDDDDWFGTSLASIGDLDGDGIAELAVGARFDDDGGFNAGAVWILFLNADGTVRSEQKISEGSGGFAGGLDGTDIFGGAVTGLGDLDGDGVEDIAVGAEQDSDDVLGGRGHGAVWILFLDVDGTVKSWSKVSTTSGGFTGAVDPGDAFGADVACLGDQDGDGVQDLAVGATSDDDGFGAAGAVWILFLETDGSVKSHAKLSHTSGGLSLPLGNSANLGVGLSRVPDIDGDLRDELAVGSERNFFGIVFLETDGTVRAQAAIGEDLSGHAIGAFGANLEGFDFFAQTLDAAGDVDGDGIPDIAVGAARDDDGGANRGAVWVVMLSASTWQGLGNGLPGTIGLPRLSGQGALVEGDLTRIDLLGALPGGSATLVLGFASLSAPFKGGVLVPFPHVLLFGLPIDGNGDLLLSFPWVAGIPSGVTTWFQYWIADPGAIFGFAASNAVSGTTP